MNPSGIRRNFKNIVHNYTDAQVKVREATSNDPWGPSSTLMSEIADLTYNMVAFSEIMMMIWKRLNDHGKNWRHVYKALMLLEYMIKTGSEKVAQQCKENIFAIQTLKDFQYFEENRDQGVNVREKAKQLVALLKDDERLKNERARALKAKERFAQAVTGIGHDGQIPSLDGSAYRCPESYNDTVTTRERRISSELECARPQTAGEEELQLQLALAMSKEEADQEDQKRRSDDVRLQMAITQSEEDFSVSTPGSIGKGPSTTKIHDTGISLETPHRQSNLVDLLDVAVPSTSNILGRNTDPWGMPVDNSSSDMNRQQNKSLNDLLGLNLAPTYDKSSTELLDLTLYKTNDPFSPGIAGARSTTTSPITSDPWPGRPASSLGVPSPAAFGRTPPADPWAPSVSSGGVDPWGVSPPNPLTNSSFGSSPSLAANGDLNSFDPLANSQTSTKKTPENFLGENSSLVNLDSLIGGSKVMSQVPGSTNPFAAQPGGLVLVPPQPQRVSLNEMRTQQQHINMMGLNYNHPSPAAAFPPQLSSSSSSSQIVSSHGTTAAVGHPIGANNPFL